MAGKSKPSARKTQKTIVFLHPDLGIGGAERLVVDAAVGLQNRGHKVVVYTSHCDPKHCFDEARDGTLEVRVRGNTIVPPSILSRFSILCAILRQIHLILQIHFSSELASLAPDAFFVDQLSAGLPLLQFLCPSARIFFYCHFPDLLLAQGRQRWWKRAYRLPFDALEQWSMSYADMVAVNSDFTKRVVSETWPRLAAQKELETVYPCVDTKPKKKEETAPGVVADDDDDGCLWGGKKFLLSINRFERKKEIDLAVRAFAGLAPESRAGVRLVVAGGYDHRIAENVTHHRELVELTQSLGLSHMTASTIPTALQAPDQVDVLFLLSVPNLLKDLLLRHARLLVYTPSGEHFGIVPLEAMLAGVPVLAASAGGPVETVVDGETGWLREPGDPQAWADVMDKVLGELDDEALAAMGRAGADRVRDRFGEAQMAARMDGILDEALALPARTPPSSTLLLLLLLVVPVLVAGLALVAGALLGGHGR